MIFRKNYIDPESFTRRENNNFDLFRIFGAMVVIFSHTYAIAGGYFPDEPLFKITEGRISVGSIFLYTFFILSGFLVTKSYAQSKSKLHYIYKRALRIFPALIAVVLLTMFVIGPLFNELSVADYFSERHTWGYLRNLSIYRLQTTLPGIFPDNPDPYFANTNFWTVAIEFTWYLGVAVLGMLAFFRYRWSLFVLLGVMYLVFGFFGDWMLSKDIPLLGLELKPVMRLGLYFMAGSIIYHYRGFFLQLNPLWLPLLIPLWFGTVLIGWTDWTSPLFLPLITILIATLRWPWVHKVASYGDPSYGMYIWGVPLQQMVVALLGTNWFVAFFVTVPLAYGVGLLSWHFVEKPALKYRNLFWPKNP